MSWLINPSKCLRRLAKVILEKNIWLKLSSKMFFFSINDKCFRKVWPAFLAIVHHFYPADGMVFHRLCLDVLRLAHALVFGLTHPADPTHALVRGLEPRTTPRHPRTGQCVDSLQWSSYFPCVVRCKKNNLYFNEKNQDFSPKLKGFSKMKGILLKLMKD